ncbi:MAG: hypothetical protein L0271_06610 [Gemmatimonadetes bacterium]|nr:hypothetical protein [Gemmatimonadota bacterium]
MHSGIDVAILRRETPWIERFPEPPDHGFFLLGSRRTGKTTCSDLGLALFAAQLFTL